MSKLSGKCDLYDHIYDIGCKGTTDEMSKMEKFNIFKQRTGGVIYQDIPLEVTKDNIDLLIEKDNLLEKTDDGNYIYINRKYKTIKALNKAGYYYRRKIYFDTTMDIVEYLPYVIAVLSSGPDSEYVQIASRPYPEERYLENLKYGILDDQYVARYKKMLINEYAETFDNYNKQFNEKSR